MRPRGFSIGFGPALAKVRRNDVDYAFRAIPLGGYVTIPGMVRPQASDVDVYVGKAVQEAPELVGPAERLKRTLEAEDFDAAQGEFAALVTTMEGAGASEKQVERARKGIGDALGDDAYWRQAVWRRVVALGAGPVTNLVFAVVLFAIVLMSAGGKATTKVEQVFEGRPAHVIGLMAGDRIVSINGALVTPSDITREISSSEGKAADPRRAPRQ